MNKVILQDCFPLPLIEDQLDCLQNAKVFSTLDLENGFFHVPVSESSRKYTSFVTHSGQYQFKRVPFGLSNSPSVFQRYINSIFRDLMRQNIALTYIDDIIIPAEDDESAVRNLKLVMERCKEFGLKLNFDKCRFLKRKILFLGHEIENQKIMPSPSKVEALVKYKTPQNLKQVESFLGLANYFRKFIYNFSIIAKPLTDLKKHNVKFEFGERQLFAFNKLKEVMSETPVLKIFNESHETELHTDASMDGYGAILLQKCPEDGELHPVYFYSQKTTDAERKYCSYELEILAVVEAVAKFRVYLLGRHFKLITDCNAFVKTMDKKDLCTRVARYVICLQEYDFTVEHRSGTQMRHVDALSRNPIMIIQEEDIVLNIRRAQVEDDELKTIFEVLKERENYDGYFMKSNVLYKLVSDDELLVVPKRMQREIIKRAHDRGHFAVKKTKELIDKDFYIPNLEDKIRKHILNCIHCVIYNRKHGKQEGELHPLHKESKPLYSYHIDFLGPLETTSKHYKHIFAVIDSFTKFCWLYPTKSTSAKDAITKLQSQSVNFGNPFQLISDRGSAFTADEFRQYCEDENIRHSKITTGLPRANGQIERLNSTIIGVLSKLSIDDPTKWYRYVDKVQQVINSTYCRSIDSTPFELLTGVKMRTKDDLTIKQFIDEQQTEEFCEDREHLRQEAKRQILKVQNENCRNFGRKRKKPSQYKIGDRVAIKRTQLVGGLKLKPKYLGPYEIVKTKPNDTYDVVKIGRTEGPVRTTTCAEYMKPWPNVCEQENDDETFEANI